MHTPLRIAIADDHALFRQGLKSQLRLHPGLTVAAEIERADQRAPLLGAGPVWDPPPVLVVTASERAGEAVEAIRAGARAVVFKRFAIESLMAALTAVMAGRGGG